MCRPIASTGSTTASRVMDPAAPGRTLLVGWPPGYALAMAGLIQTP
jgi:hypothetical protein